MKIIFFKIRLKGRDYLYKFDCMRLAAGGIGG